MFAVEKGTPRQLRRNEEDVVNKFRFGGANSHFLCTLAWSPTVQKSVLLAAIQKEIHRHLLVKSLPPDAEGSR